MKKTVFILLVLACSGSARSFSQNSPELIVEKFFSQLQMGNSGDAVKSLPVSSIIAGDTSFVTEMISKLSTNQKFLGKYCGYELIGQNEVTASYVISDYFIKYLNAPRRIQFTFYKPADNWQINNVNLNVRERQNNTSRTSRRL